MEHSIASYLFRNKNCFLPGIGELKVVRTPADLDFFNHQIKAPVETIEFIPVNENSSVFNELSAESQHLKMLLDTENTVALDGIGKFTKDHNGNIQFAGETIIDTLTQPVNFESVIHREVRQALVTIAAKAKEPAKVKEIINDKKLPEEKTLPRKQRWWVAALITGIIGLAALFFHIFQDGPTTGNIIIIPTKDAGDTYKVSK